MHIYTCLHHLPRPRGVLRSWREGGCIVGTIAFLGWLDAAGMAGSCTGGITYNVAGFDWRGVSRVGCAFRGWWLIICE